MNAFLQRARPRAKSLPIQAVYPLGKRSLALCTGAFLLLVAGTANACLATCVGLFIENDIDSNGNISVVNGTKVKVGWEILQNDDKLLKSKDRIELVRVSDNTVVSSVVRGKGSSGTASLKVKNSEGEELFVRYRAKKDGSYPVATPNLSDPNHTPLVSIAGANLTDLIVRTNALETASTADANVYAVGDVGPAGGWVFRITDGGLHGLEAAPGDQAKAPWGCSGTDLTGGEETAVGEGGQLTGDILSACMEPDIAARIVATYWVRGFNDWFLPSKDELLLMLKVLTIDIPGNIAGFVADPYPANIYWASGEYDNRHTNQPQWTTEEYSWVACPNGNCNGINLKSQVYNVRAIRAF